MWRVVAEFDREELRRRLAEIEHERWADWQRWVHGQCSSGFGGNLVIPAALVERWERQIATRYEALSPEEQACDLREVDRYWPLISSALEERERLQEQVMNLQGEVRRIRAIAEENSRANHELIAHWQRAVVDLEYCDAALERAEEAGNMATVRRVAIREARAARKAEEVERG